MRLFLCCAVLATVAVFGAHGFPTDQKEELPRRVSTLQNKPLQNGVDKPRPNLLSQPTPQDASILPSGQSANSFIFEAVQAAEAAAEAQTAAEAQAAEAPVADASAEAPEILSSPAVQVSPEVPELLSSPVVQASPEFPELLSSSAIQMHSEPAHDPILETASSFPVPEAIFQDAIPEIETTAEAAPSIPIELQHLQVDQLPAVSASIEEVSQIDSNAQEIINAVEMRAVSAKTRRHTGVELPSNMRIGDFEDVEMDSGSIAPEYPSNQEQVEMTPDISREEMILMAMEQMHNNLPQVNLIHARPIAGSRPNLLAGKPNHQYSFSDDDDSEENDSTVDMRNGYQPATIVQEQYAPIKQMESSSKGIIGSEEATHSQSFASGSKNKPRPYGMDKPSKNRPTLDSGMKDKNEHFGLPHSASDYVQKGEAGVSSIGVGTTNYLGFQIPYIKWSSFSDYFPSLWGTRNSQYGKSDQTVEICEEDEEEASNTGVRSPIIQNGALCNSGSVSNNCNLLCTDKGYVSGTCMGPYPTPGCMCRRPGPGANSNVSKNLGMFLTPLKDEPVSDASRIQDLQSSAAPSCKKCACIDSCKKSGSFTGFCADRCYCGVPYHLAEA